MIVAQMDPTNKYIRFVFQPGASYSPAQSLTGVFEIPLYTVSGTTLTDVRQFALSDPNKIAKVRMHRANPYYTSTTDARYGFDTYTYPVVGNPAPGGLYTCPYAADYLMICQGGFVSTGEPQSYVVEINHNGSNVAWNGRNSAGPGEAVTATCTDIVPCKAGDTLCMYHHCSTNNLQGLTNSYTAYMSIRAMS
jgi:hypothetical protein